MEFLFLGIKISLLFTGWGEVPEGTPWNKGRAAAENDLRPPLVPRLNIPFPVLSGLINISSGKRLPRLAFAGCIETLSSQESASVSKIQLSERSEFCIFDTAFSRFL